MRLREHSIVSRLDLGALRRMIKSRGGTIHILEAFMAGVIIFTTLMYAAAMPRERDRPTGTSLEAVGMETLLMLDGNGTLGSLVETESWESIELCLRSSLPAGVTFNLTVLDETGAPVNDRPISNGGLVGRDMDSVDYLMAVKSSDCPLFRLRLKLGE